MEHFVPICAMAAQRSSGLALFNVFTVSVTILEAGLLGFLSPNLHLVNNPLTVTRICACTLALVNSVGIYWLQGSYHIKKWQPVKGFILVALSSIFFHALTVLYGAPLLESVAETYHFACLLAVLTVLPSCAALGINSFSWLRLYAHNRPDSPVEACVQLTTLCSLVGAWIGAFPIPLDWDRPWQTWPITCVIGTLTGNTIGHLWSSYASSSKTHALPKSKLG